MRLPVVDLFAGPGGWDVAARKLGLDPLGIEFDDAACATRAAAGLRTLQADVSALDPIKEFEGGGLIASPPCQAFSVAGKGHGRRAMPAYEEAIGRWLEGKPPSREELDEACEDERAHLVLEPLRWALALRPTWIACEQVKPVAPLWHAMASALRTVGYSAWAGVLSAEQYGVPQTRERAILIARLGRPVEMPRATHRAYVAPRRKAAQEDSLFAAPEADRITERGEESLLPWISMAEAVSWPPELRLRTGNNTMRSSRDAQDMVAVEHIVGERPAPVLDRKVGGAWKVGPDGSHKAAPMSWKDTDRVGFPRLNDTPSNKPGEGDTGKYRERDLRPASEPAFALTEKARSWSRFRASARSNATERTVDEPAPTITGGHDHEERMWIADDATAVPVTMQEAAMLQSFPADYPWRGTRTKVFEQIGNAIPPLLAEAILREIETD
jgi:DNA (cytosine-5)-methyltransferase 1